MAVDPGFPPDPARTNFDFDTLDVPPDRFLVAGRAWRSYRRGEVDGGRFGFTDYLSRGPGRIASQLVRDLASLNKLELLPWDSWALGRTPFNSLKPEEIILLDRVADTTADAGDKQFPHVRTLYGSDQRLTVPGVISALDHSADGRPIEVTLALHRTIDRTPSPMGTRPETLTGVPGPH